MKILLTGAGGFVGQRFAAYNKDRFQIQPLSLRNNDWKNTSFEGFDVVVHLAGKAHEMGKIDDSIYYQVNTELTKELFQRAAAAGIKQFIYISSTKVFGDQTDGVLTETSPCNPNDAYGKSKLEAEQFLLNQQGSCSVAIVRPPLVYGPGVKGNMISLLELAARKVPLPFKGIDNRRSMVFVDNLVELINAIIDKKAAGIFVAGDRRPLSTAELVQLIRGAMNRKPGMFRLPGFLKAIIRKFRPGLYIRLFGSYEVNPENSFQRLAFTPPYSTEQGIRQMVNWYLTESTKK